MLKEWLNENKFTLTLSSGFFGFYAHLGLLTALEEEGLIPNLITGASSGALAGGCWAAGTDTETIKSVMFGLTKECFWDPKIGFGLLKGQKFAHELSKLLPIQNIVDCKIPFKASVYNIFSRRTEVMDSGPINKIIRASCAVPLLFQPVWINGTPYLDGGIKDRPALMGAPNDQFILYHHLKSHSKWRSKKSKRVLAPTRKNMYTINFEDLPRVGPNNLEQGKKAFDIAYRNSQKLLKQPFSLV